MDRNVFGGHDSAPEGGEQKDAENNIDKLIDELDDGKPKGRNRRRKSRKAAEQDPWQEATDK